MDTHEKDPAICGNSLMDMASLNGGGSMVRIWGHEISRESNMAFLRNIPEIVSEISVKFQNPGSPLRLNY